MFWLRWTLQVVAWGSLSVFVVTLLARAVRFGYRRWRPRDGERVQFAVGRRVWLLPLAAASVLLSRSIVIVPNGSAGVRVSQSSGTRPGTLFPGAHWIRPLVDDVVLYPTRDRILTTEAAAADSSRGRATAAEVLTAQSREGLSVGLAVTVRYRLEPKRLDHIHDTLPPVDTELVPIIVASVFRQVLPDYLVREVFATKREEVRTRAARLITDTLGEDGIVVKEVLLRNVVLPVEYQRGLEGLLLKEQENERMVFDLQIKEKQVKSAELEAEAQKARRIKEAEAAATVHVLQAKAEADAMQHTLPLKEKQIEQARLEADARKEATLKNAEAASQAKLIDARAEKERTALMAEAEAGRIRLVAAADAERMAQEGTVLRSNPLLIQKIVAERLSDKMQIMMVPMDGQNFFANDVFRAASSMGAVTSAATTTAPDDGKRRTAQRR